MSDPLAFISNGIQENQTAIAYQLAEENYDVWLMGYRGTFGSRQHQIFDADTDKEFWDFSFEEIG